MNLTSWIASRYLVSGRSGRYAPLLAFTSVAGVAAGVMALVIVMSVMRGFRQELTDKLVGFDAHITMTRSPGAEVLAKNEVEEIFAGEDVRDIAPFVQGEVIASADSPGDAPSQGARVRGIDPSEMGAIEGVSFYFPEDRGFYGAVVGSEVTGQINVHPDFSDKVVLTAPLAEVLPNGEIGPNRKIFEVSGAFRSGMFDYDSKYILLSLEDAKSLLGLQAEEGFMVRIPDAADVQDALKKIRRRLPEGWSAAGWDEQNKRLFAALKLERAAMGGVLVMVVLIASFSIVGVVLLVTAAKRKDIAILESMGMTRRGIGRIFLVHASLIGAAGSLLGLIGGLAVCFALKIHPLRLPESYYLDWLPVDVNIWAAVCFAVLGVLIAAVSSLYPVSQAMKTDPVEVLRWE